MGKPEFRLGAEFGKGEEGKGSALVRGGVVRHEGDHEGENESEDEHGGKRRKRRRRWRTEHTENTEERAELPGICGYFRAGRGRWPGISSV